MKFKTILCISKGVMSYEVAVKTNLKSDFLLQAVKHASTSHGMSMGALAMLDANHSNLKMELAFKDVDTLENCAEQMTAVWDKCESNKVLFRSVKKDGNFLAYYFGRQLTEDTAYPSSHDEYKFAKVILDIDLGTELNPIYIYKFYRLNEAHPRVLTLRLGSV